MKKTDEMQKIARLFDRAPYMSKLIFMRSQSIFEYLSTSTED